MINHVLVNCARAAICSELYRVGQDRIDQRVAEWKADPATTHPDAGHWMAALRSGAVTIGFAESALRLSVILTDLDHTDADLQALGAIFDPQSLDRFPCVETLALCERWGTHGTDTETPRDFLQAVVAAEAAAAARDFLPEPANPAPPFDHEEQAAR